LLSIIGIHDTGYQIQDIKSAFSKNKDAHVGLLNHTTKISK